MNKSQNGKAKSKVDEESKREILIQPLVQEKLDEDKLVDAVILFLSLIGPVLLVQYGPNPSNMAFLAYAFVCTLIVCGSIWLLNRAVSYLAEGLNWFVKYEVKRRIPVSELRVRWNRTSSADFTNVVLETRLNVYFQFEYNSKKFSVLRYFYSSFFRQAERLKRLFDERCFFDLEEVEQIEQKYPRFLPKADRSGIEQDLKIEELEKELEDARTMKARLTKAKKKLDGARKEGFFFSNMILEMVVDPTPKQQFSHEEYKAIADTVIEKDYIKKLKLVRPANSVIEEFRKNIPIEFRKESNTAK
ncbi:hypothetical protein [Maridesulfovibrio sp.]|uniref:hypothetical protein n=1 Tax=Maridesulfovibrio sp. TaxID=2795000 RepID=UPI0029CAA2E6|nr:hypothetical protein [Maridesulfovibrio sp.]